MSCSLQRTARHSILIVDDNEVDRYLLKRLLRDAGVMLEVVEAADGHQAIAFFENLASRGKLREAENWPLAVLLDINMPRKSGLEFLDEFARLRDQYTAIYSSVIMLSTAHLYNEEKRAFSHDFVRGCFKKGSVNPERLALLLDSLIEERGAEDSSASYG